MAPYGDGIITPAMSVLSALEGLTLGAPVLTPYVLPAARFVVQSRGTTGLENRHLTMRRRSLAQRATSV